jgi:hypothetical protein
MWFAKGEFLVERFQRITYPRWLLHRRPTPRPPHEGNRARIRQQGRPAGAEAPVWQLLDAPDGTHVHVLDPDFRPEWSVRHHGRDVPQEVLDVGCYSAPAPAPR